MRPARGRSSMSAGDAYNSAPALQESAGADPHQPENVLSYSRTLVLSYRQNAVPFARLPPEDVSELIAVCSTQLPVADTSGLRFIDTPSVPLSADE